MHPVGVPEDAVPEVGDVVRFVDVVVVVLAVARLEGLRAGSVEVLEPKVVARAEREALGRPPLAPQHVFGEAPGAGAHVHEVQQLLLGQQQLALNSGDL